MYQTIGMVRYSGCNGRATSYLLMSFHTGDRSAARTHSCGIPASRAACWTSRSSGSRKQARWAAYRSVSFSTDAASRTLSAS